MRVIVTICRYVSDVDFTAGAWPRSHAGIDPMPDNMNLDYLKLRYREFQKYEVMIMSVVGGQPKKKKHTNLETVVNEELIKIGDWLDANKLSLNTSKSNIAIFNPYQHKPDCKIQLKIFNNDLKNSVPLEQEIFVKYLGIPMDGRTTDGRTDERTYVCMYVCM